MALLLCAFNEARRIAIYGIDRCYGPRRSAQPGYRARKQPGVRPLTEPPAHRAVKCATIEIVDASSVVTGAMAGSNSRM